MEAIQIVRPQYRYRLIPTGGSSAKYGQCEICGGQADSVYRQSEERSFRFGSAKGWEVLPCSFGHKGCLKSIRK